MMNIRIKKIIALLQKLYPDPKPSLNFRNGFESLIATILSAQCTDERVNKVTPALFAAAPTPEKMLALDAKNVTKYIKSTGFYRTKTKNILGACRVLVEQYGGIVPASLEELQKLPGVGRKTASVVLCQAFGIPAFPVDRHVLRVANRLALAHSKDPDTTDEQLRKAIPENMWISSHLQLVYHGRKICRPKPKCKECILLPHCPEGKKLMRLPK